MQHHGHVKPINNRWVGTSPLIVIAMSSLRSSSNGSILTAIQYRLRWCNPTVSWKILTRLDQQSNQYSTIICHKNMWTIIIEWKSKHYLLPEAVASHQMLPVTLVCCPWVALLPASIAAAACRAAAGSTCTAQHYPDHTQYTQELIRMLYSQCYIQLMQLWAVWSPALLYVQRGTT